MSNTIPASQIVDIVPGVVGAGGIGLTLQGLILTQGTRVPIGVVQPFASRASVTAYFGSGSAEDAAAAIYFTGPDNSQIKPGSIFFTQYPQTAVQAFLRGGTISGLTLAQLQAISGTLSVVVDGTARAAASINLSSANSFSAAAALIQTGLNGSPTTLASVTGAIAATTSSFTGTIAGNVLTVSAMTSGVIVPGTSISGTGVSAAVIRNQLSGTAGGIGTYAVSVSQTVATATAIAGTYGTMTVSAVSSGTLAIGQQLAGASVTAGTQITALGTGTGGTGTYIVSSNTVVASTTITATPVNVAVSFDSVSGAFVVTSGIFGAASTSAFATGTIAIPLLLTSATGAVLSQGSAGQTPSGFMTNLYNNITANWATFMNLTDPDAGSGNAQKLLFAQWNASNNQETAYVCWDTDASPTTTVPASTSLGQLLATSQIGGTCLIWGVDNTKAAFVCGWGASIDFTQPNGRSNAAFRSESGLTPDVTGLTVATNLIANGYNYYGVSATAAQQFNFLYPGSVSGQFLWMDSYIDQIYLNNALQLAIMELLTQVRSIPYNPVGYGLLDAACLDPINAAVNAGVIRPNVPLSALQAAEVNNAAGRKIDNTLSNRGWYLLINPATAQTRAARGSPPCTLFYMDGQSIQKVTLNSLEVA